MNLLWIVSTFFLSQTALNKALAYLAMTLAEIHQLSMDSMETKLIFHRSTKNLLTIKEQKNFKESVGTAKIAISSSTIIRELGAGFNLFK
jgi:hypothetical protein